MNNPKDATHALLKALADGIQKIEDTPGMDDIDNSVAYSNLMDLTSFGLEGYVQNDPGQPRWVDILAGPRKIGGDNQHARYFFAPLSPKHRYRIRGKLQGAIYLGFTVYGCEADEEHMHIVTNTNSSEITMRPDGSFELELSAAKNGGVNHIHLKPETNSIILRQYFGAPALTQGHHFEIEALDGPAPSGVNSSAEIARRIAQTAAFLRGWVNMTPMPWPEDDAAWNQVCNPFHTGESTGHWSTPDNIHAFGHFRLAEDEALVLRGTAVPCTYWSCHLWNISMQTFDFDNFRCAQLGHSLPLTEDSGWRIVIARGAPRGPGWLDTAGHHRGFIYFRWLETRQQLPGPIQAELVKTDTVPD